MTLSKSSFFSFFEKKTLNKGFVLTKGDHFLKVLLKYISK